MRLQNQIEPTNSEDSVAERLESNDHFTGVGINVVVISLSIVALLPMLLSSQFWALPTWQIVVVLLLWTIYVVNGTGGMMLHENFIERWYAGYLYFGIQLLVMAGLLLLTKEMNGAIWIMILPVAAQSLAYTWRFTVAICAILLGLMWLAYFNGQPLGETLLDLLSIGVSVLFTLIFTSIALRESAARSQVQQLALDLRQANHRLAEYAAQAEELATMRERNRVAREIHDNLGHDLTVVNVQIEAAKTIMTTQPEKAHNALNKAQNLTQEGLAAVRQSVSTLRESPLANQTLAEALAQLAEEVRESGLVTELTITGEPAERDPKIELTLYRAVQEGLTNVRKHARASRVDIHLRYDAQETVLTLQDNGIGTDLAQKSASSFGLVGIEERVNLLNGRIHITTAPQQGFQFTITLPA